MSSLRTHNNRRRARILKADGLYTLRRHHVGPTWKDSGASPSDILADIKSMMLAIMAAPRGEPIVLAGVRA